MVIYKNFLKVVWIKKIVVVLYTVIFFILSFSFLVNSKNEKAQFSETVLKLIIIDEDNSALSQNLIQYLKTKSDVIEDTKIQNLDKVKKEISLGYVDAGIVINKNLEEKLLADDDCVVCLKDDRNHSSFYLDMQIKRFLLFAKSLKQETGEINFNKIHEVLSEEVNVEKITAKENAGANTWFKHFFNFFAWFSFSIIFNLIGWAMFLVKTPTIKTRNAVSPVSTFRFTVETFAAQLTVVFCILFLVIGLAVVINIGTISSVPIFAYCFNCVVYAIVILAFIFMMNAWLKKDSLLGIVGTVLPLALSFISGVFIPAEFISSKVLMIAKFFPTYYFVQANEFIHSFFKIDLKNLTALFLFFLGYFVLGLFFTKKNRSQSKIEYEQK